MSSLSSVNFSTIHGSRFVLIWSAFVLCDSVLVIFTIYSLSGRTTKQLYAEYSIHSNTKWHCDIKNPRSYINEISFYLILTNISLWKALHIPLRKMLAASTIATTAKDVAFAYPTTRCWKGPIICFPHEARGFRFASQHTVETILTLKVVIQKTRTINCKTNVHFIANARRM